MNIETRTDEPPIEVQFAEVPYHGPEMVGSMITDVLRAFKGQIAEMRMTPEALTLLVHETGDAAAHKAAGLRRMWDVA